jgi:hypothetical protein
MATNSIRRSGANPEYKADGKRSGFTIDPGPYEAIVTGHVDGSRMGQLQVKIPDWSGYDPQTTEENNSDIVVSYASPFYGTTFGTDSGTNPNSPQTAGQSYGMWMVPPDIGNKVLVTFVAGDMNRGYWFACVYDGPSHHMVPGISRAIGGADATKDPNDGLNQYISSNSVLPVTEFNITETTAFNSDGLTATSRYPHEFQTIQYVMQGLDQDPIRGAISSSSMREAPSNVYGISTPGRKATATDQISAIPDIVFYRKGGHQFVMDDGDKDGVDQLIRLRTSGGHQILMNDTENILYIASKSGSQWIEFSPNGSINVYGAAGINMRSQGPMNLHSDIAIAMNAPSIKINASSSGTPGGPPMGSIKISSSGGIDLQAITSIKAAAIGSLSLSAIGMASLSSGAKLSVSSVGPLGVSSAVATSISGSIVNIDGGMLNLNCTKPTPGMPPIPPIPVTPKSHPDAQFNGTGWVKGGTKVDSVCTVVPGHEPWERPDKKK